MARGRVIAGIDIGTDKICTVITSVSEESGKLNVIGVASHPSNGVRKSQIVDLEDTINAITESVEAAERMAGYTISDAYVSISGAHIKSQNSTGVVAVSEPEGEITPDDIERVIEAARAISLASSVDILHVVPRDFIVDSQAGIKDPMGMTGVRLESQVHVITASSTAMRNIAKCIGEIGINVSNIVFAGLASSDAVLSETEKELGVVLVDIGAGTTSVCIYVEGSLAYSSVIPIGARNITNDIAIGMRISIKSAEKIKLFLSQSPQKVATPTLTSDKELLKKRRQEDKINLSKLNIKEDLQTASRKTLVEGIIKPRLNELFSLVGSEIKESGLAGLTPAGVVITGGGAETVGIVDSCKRTLSLPARIGKPIGLSGLVDEITSSPYATITGLILYAKGHTPEGKDRFNFAGVGRIVSRIPLKGVADRAIKVIKSLLP